MIEPTFRRYALPGFTDWKNPLHNTIAAIRYIADRYGSPYNLPKGGYAHGGIVPFDGFGFLHKDEIVLPKDIGDLIRRAVRTQAAFSSASTGVGRVLNDAASSLIRAFDKASVGGVPFGPSSQPAAAPFASARDSAPAAEGGITLEMHAHFEVGSISGVGDVSGEMSRFFHTEVVPAFRATVKDMIRSGEVGQLLHARMTRLRPYS